MITLFRLAFIRSLPNATKCNVRMIRSLVDDKNKIKGPPRPYLNYTDEEKWPYEIVNPYKEPEIEKTREYEESKAEWHFVEKLLPKLYIPEPKAKEVTPSGWRPPKVEAPQLPYFVNRTKNHMHAVYLELRNAQSRRFTKVRYIQGDIWAFESDMKKYLEKKHQKKIPTQVHEPCGMVRFKGDFVDDIKEWLADTGF